MVVRSVQSDPGPGADGAGVATRGAARESRLWHPVAAADALGHAPLAVALLGQALVIWRDAQGGLHAWADQCPHRGARLSLGAVHGDALECPYHGWRFAARSARAGVSEGQCVLMPAQPGFSPPATHRCTVHEVQVAHGLVWVRLAPQDASAHALDAYWPTPPAFAPGAALLAEGNARSLLCGPYPVHTSAARLVENFLDLSHFGFVHAGWLGDAAHAQVQTGEVIELDDRVVAERCRAFQPRGFASGDTEADAAAGAWVDYRYEIESPFCAHLLKRASQPGGSENAIALFICPHEAHRLSVWFLMVTRNDPSDDVQLRAFQDTVFAQDRLVLESQQPASLPIGLHGPVREVHGPADRLSSAYRRLLLRAGAGLGVC